MKKVFLVTIECEENLENVINETSIDAILDDVMDGYVATKSINKGYTLQVEEQPIK